MKKIGIIGSGSWGVALGIHLAKLGNSVKIWSYAQEEADLINNEKKCKFLPGVEIPNGIICTLSYEEAIKDTDFILHVTPSKFTRDTLKQYKQYVTNQPIVICSKGFEKDTLSTLAEVINDELPNTKVAILSGPSHAEEVSIGHPTLMVAASEDDELVTMLQDVFMCETMRIYTTHDVKGVEVGGALKNILAFCGGIALEIGLGDNAFAALITRGLVEISKLGVAMGGNKETFYGLTGLGDLLVTCYSDHSRNRKAGKLIGAGKSMEETKQEVGMTIESIDNIDVAYELGKKYNVELPIVNAVYDVLYNNLQPKDAVNILMTREKKPENIE